MPAAATLSSRWRLREMPGIGSITEEFYFGLSLEQTDLCLYAKDHGISPEATGEALGLTLIRRVARFARSIRSAPPHAIFINPP